MLLKNFFRVLLFLTAFTSFSQEPYYNDVNLHLTGINLKEELASKITSTHTRLLAYSQVWESSKITDLNPNNNQEVLLIYGWEDGTDTNLKNDRTRDKNDNGGNAGNWNREHVYSQSLGTPTLGEAGPGSDAHHLRPADKDWNSTRNNRKFTNGSETASGTQANGGWFPGDEWKGDVARMMMYMHLRYGERCLPSNVGFGNNSSTPDDMIDLFLQWNAEDPVSDFEKQRNTYHENINNDFSQGNRNPFIDNPRLATRIWGGTEAEDLWGIYSSNDTEAPTTPTNLTASNVTTFSVDLSWNAATDNTAVTSYDIYIDGTLSQNTTNTSITISNLESNTSYSFTVLAKDIVNNMSAQTDAINAQILEDTEAPSIPNNIVISNQTTTSFVVSWNVATDNTAVIEYDIYVDGNKLTSTSENMFTVTNLEPDTTYGIQISAKDQVGNISNLSSIINATTNGNNSTATEIFFSEYTEGSSNNKALELVNLTANDIDLSTYSIKRQSNGGKNGDGWEEDNTLTLSGYTIKSNEVFVIVNQGAGVHSDSKSQAARDAGDYLISVADYIHPNASETNWGAPLHFNGNDPVGLFKNNVLIDIIGTFNGGDSNFAKDKTLRRKQNVIEPNITFNIDNEWDIYSKDIVDDFGKHSAITLSAEEFVNTKISFYPNPANSFIKINSNSNFLIKNLEIYTVLGTKIAGYNIVKKEINIKSLSKGVYIIKFVADNKLHSTKFIKK